MFQILFCEEPGIVRVIYLIKIILNITRFVIPIGLILMVTLDIYKNMINGFADNKEIIIKKSGNRVLAAIIVFLVPTGVNLILSLLGKIDIDTSSYQATFLDCYNEASPELISKLEENYELLLSEEEEKKRKENEILVAKFTALEKAKYEAMQKANSTTGTYSSNLTDLNMQNKVYIKNGVFYAPKYIAGNENTYSGKNCPTNPLNQGYNNPYGYNNYFFTMLQNLIAGAKEAGYNLKISTQGCRSYAMQVEYYNNMESGRAARPGNSNHGWGIASDVTFYKNATTTCGGDRNYTNCPGMKWVHEHAKDYGLHFPLLNASYKENWHIEPINLKKY